MAGRERPGLAVPIALALAPTHRAAASVHTPAWPARQHVATHTHTHTASDECWSACVVFPLSILLRCRVLWCAGFVVCFHSCSRLLMETDGGAGAGAGGTSPAKRRGRDVDVIPTFAVLRLVTRGDESLKISSYLCRILKSESRGARGPRAPVIIFLARPTVRFTSPVNYC